MHTKPMSESEGNFQNGWLPTVAENPQFCCRNCGSQDVWYRLWESSCGGYEDVKYQCRGCGRIWWVESADA